jgi:formylglycine-generating enzyme required for sulfatase activity
LFTIFVPANDTLNLKIAVVRQALPGTYLTVDTAISIAVHQSDTVHLPIINLSPSTTNHPPAFTSDSASMSGTATVGTAYIDTVHALDPDRDTLRFGFVDSIAGMVLRDSIIRWTPIPPDTGIKRISLRVIDGKGGADTLGWSIIVKDSTTTSIINRGMKLITGGVFNMGSNDTFVQQPVHSVTVSSFWMDTVEVTQAKFKSIMGYLMIDWSFTPDSSRLPACCINWYEAALYCNKLSRQNGLDTVYAYQYARFDNSVVFGRCTTLAAIVINYSAKGYRLPTEAEWEYAARSQSENSTSGWLVKFTSDASAANYAWYLYNSYYFGSQLPHAVATKLPNRYGLYDMYGNVWEWCNDWYDPNYYAQLQNNNPVGPASGTVKVLRGGSWDWSLPSINATVRSSGEPDNNGSGTSFDPVTQNRGFRIVLPAQ